MTVLWDQDVNHEVHLEDLEGGLLAVAVVDIQLVGSPEDHLEAWVLGRGNHQGRAEGGHEEE